MIPKTLHLPTKENIQLFIQEHITLILTVVSVPVLAAVALYLVFNYFAQNEVLQNLTQEVTSQRTQIEVVRKNKNLIEDNIDQYNTILSSLVPDSEDYFSIIYALEQLSKQTGFFITRYDLNIAKSTSEKLALTVSGNGNADAFMRFLQAYRFDGGRLITNERIEYTTDEFGGTQLALNFYNKKLTVDKLALPNVTKDKIDFMNSIKDKIAYSLVAPAIDASPAAYPTKTNPF